MSETDIERRNLATNIDLLGKKLRASGKAMSATDDPFVHREQIDRVASTLDELKSSLMGGLLNLRKSIDVQCVEASAEFWQRFCADANAAGWEVHGTTARRLVFRAFFVEQADDTISIEGLAGRHTPHVPKLIEILKPHIDALAENYGSLQQFVDQLGLAYDSLGGRGDVAIESIFRQHVLLMQPPAFWATIDRGKLKVFPRPAFRYLLSQVLAENTRTSNGREVRLIPSANRKDVWELFLPAEGHVVQVGRMAFVGK